MGPVSIYCDHHHDRIAVRYLSTTGQRLCAECEQRRKDAA